MGISLVPLGTKLQHCFLVLWDHLPTSEIFIHSKSRLLKKSYYYYQSTRYIHFKICWKKRLPWECERIPVCRRVPQRAAGSVSFHACELRWVHVSGMGQFVLQLTFMSLKVGETGLLGVGWYHNEGLQDGLVWRSLRPEIFYSKVVDAHSESTDHGTGLGGRTKLLQVVVLWDWCTRDQGHGVRHAGRSVDYGPPRLAMGYLCNVLSVACSFHRKN